MTQSTLIPAGQSAATGDVTLADGSTATFSLVPAAGQSIPAQVAVPITLAGVPQAQAVLTAAERTIKLAGAGGFHVARPDISAFGVDVAVLVDQ